MGEVSGDEASWVEPGVLYLVPTPIGNLADWSPRAEAVVRNVDLVLAEDTRETGNLLRHFGIATVQWSFHAHNWQKMVPIALERLKAGQSVALVADRGMPAVSDPGRELVAAALEAGIKVSPLPGPSAVTAAFAASGYPHPCVFWGFLPSRGRERAQILTAISATAWTQLLFEAPHRLARTLGDLGEVLGPEHPLVVVREISKRHEEVWRGTLAEAQVNPELQRGELVLVLGPRRPEVNTTVPDWALVVAEVQREVAAGHAENEAVRLVARRHAISRRELYQQVQAAKAATRPPSSAP